MPKYTVEVARTAVHTTSFTVTAKDDDEATEKAQALCDQADEGNNLPKELGESAEWTEDNTTYEINSVDGE